MSEHVDNLVDRVKTVVGRSTATAFVPPQTEDRRFIAEAFFASAAVFLLNRYFGGFFKPVEEAGVRHRKAAARIFKKLWKGSPSHAADDDGRRAIQDSLVEAKSLDSPERRAAAEAEIQRVLREYGESEVGATRKASEITNAIFGR